MHNFFFSIASSTTVNFIMQFDEWFTGILEESKYGLFWFDFNTLSVSSQAFAWFSDLLVEHAEIFWSLFAVDMDSTLEMQPPDTWDSFPLFQLLNDYLRNDGKSLFGYTMLNLYWDRFSKMTYDINLKSYLRYFLT